MANLLQYYWVRSVQCRIVAIPVFHEGIKRVYTACYSSYLETLGDFWIRMSPYGLHYICHISKPYNKVKQNLITTTAEDELMMKSEQWLWMLPYPGVTTITRSLLPLADNLACRRLWLDKVLVRDSCKTNTKQPHKMTYYPFKGTSLQKI